MSSDQRDPQSFLKAAGKEIVVRIVHNCMPLAYGQEFAEVALDESSDGSYVLTVLFRLSEVLKYDAQVKVVLRLLEPSESDALPVIRVHRIELVEDDAGSKADGVAGSDDIEDFEGTTGRFAVVFDK